MLCLAAVGAFAGVFFSDRWALTKEELISNGNTEVFDSDGKQIALLSVSEGNGNRKVIPLDKMGKYTVNAYIAVEDKRFYEHKGVDILRTGKATISYLLHKADDTSVGGGSTITQQLVKNLMNDDADTGTAGIERKIREMSRAYQIEKILEKDEILEKYLNIIFVGGAELHGVEYGSQYYFAKSAKDLDLAESAFLAGINNSPNMYNPYDENNDHSDLIKSRTKLVLGYMKEQNRISDNQEEAEKLYNEAVVTEAVSQAAKDLAKKKDISLAEANAMISSGGYKLYTTQNSKIQKTVLNEMAKKSYIEKRTVSEKDKNGKYKQINIQTQSGMTIIEPKTGYVVAMGGAFGSDKGSDKNFAINTDRQTGSSIKPLANVATGLEEKVINASTLYYDNVTDFSQNGQRYIPKNAGGYQGLCTVRKSIEVSSNIVNIKIFSNIGAKKVIEYLHAFGLDTYNEKDDSGLSLAIGGSKHSSSTLQMAAAYAAIANDGVYIEPTFYKKLVDANGKTILEPEQETRRVISEGNAYIIKNILIDVVTGAQGTGNECYINGMDVAVKTGTTDNDGDTWLCGFTPYYAAATWNGYPYGGNISMYNVGNARKLWANVMKTVHKDLKGERFKKPDSVVTGKVCRTSGKLATSKCASTYTEYFTEGNLPKQCDGHTLVEICKDTKKVANEYCPSTEEKAYADVPEKERNAWWKVSGKNKLVVPTEKCTKHTEETSKITVVNVVGKTEAAAKVALAGLSIQVIEGHDSTKANGIVISQSLTAGTKVEKGVKIVITVNKLTTVPPSGGNTTTPPSGGNTTTPPSGDGNTNTNTNTPGGGNNTTPPSDGNTTNTNTQSKPTT